MLSHSEESYTETDSYEGVPEESGIFLFRLYSRSFSKLIGESTEMNRTGASFRWNSDREGNMTCCVPCLIRRNSVRYPEDIIHISADVRPVGDGTYLLSAVIRYEKPVFDEYDVLINNEHIAIAGEAETAIRMELEDMFGRDSRQIFPY